MLILLAAASVTLRRRSATMRRQRCQKAFILSMDKVSDIVQYVPEKQGRPDAERASALSATIIVIDRRIGGLRSIEAIPELIAGTCNPRKAQEEDLPSTSSRVAEALLKRIRPDRARRRRNMKADTFPTSAPGKCILMKSRKRYRWSAGVMQHWASFRARRNHRL